MWAVMAVSVVYYNVDMNSDEYSCICLIVFAFLPWDSSQGRMVCHVAKCASNFTKGE